MNNWTNYGLFVFIWMHFHAKRVFINTLVVVGQIQTSDIKNVSILHKKKVQIYLIPLFFKS